MITVLKKGTFTVSGESSEEAKDERDSSDPQVRF